jgi:hypothetical protein
MSESNRSTDDVARRLAGADPAQMSKFVDSLVERRLRERERLARPEMHQRLRSLYELLTTNHTFSPGELVKWKHGLKNKRRPDYDIPVVVLALVHPPVNDHEQNAGSAYFREPLDLVIGIMDDDDELDGYHVDSRRFEPFA